MNQISRLFHIILPLLITMYSMGQSDGQSARITLNSGVVMTGKVLKIDYQKQVDLLVGATDTLHINWSDISQLDFIPNTVVVAPSSNRVPRYLRKEEPYVDTTFYFSWSNGIPVGLDSWGDPVAGFSTMVEVGKGFNYKHHVGVRTGYEFYFWPDVNIIPLAVNYYGRLKPEGKSLYYGISLGYGIPSSTQLRYSRNSVVKGGALINPYIGITRKRHPNRSICIEFGYKSQEIYTEYDSYFWNFIEPTPIRVNEYVKYQRFDIRFALRWD